MSDKSGTQSNEKELYVGVFPKYYSEKVVWRYVAEPYIPRRWEDVNPQENDVCMLRLSHQLEKMWTVGGHFHLFPRSPVSMYSCSPLVACRCLMGIQEPCLKSAVFWVSIKIGQRGVNRKELFVQCMRDLVTSIAETVKHWSSTIVEFKVRQEDS